MIPPVPPIFVVEGIDDVYVFPSVATAGLWLEPWWVEQNEGSAYDAEGRLLRFEIEKHNVVITLGESHPTHAAELMWKLRSFLNSIGEPLDADSANTLSFLVQLCANRTGVI